MTLTTIAKATLGAAVHAATGRRSKWAVLAVGVVLAGLAGPLASKLVPLEKNSPSSFLPSGAASTKVLNYQEAHGAGITPAVVVYERSGGLRPADRAIVRRARASVGAAVPRLSGAGTPGPVEFSSNGRAASFSVPLRATTPDQVLADDVKSMRAIVAREATTAGTEPGPGGLRVAVGGPAGSAADAVTAFAGIDGKLLVITGLIVAALLLLTYRSPVLWLLPLLSVGMAVSWSQGAAYALAKLGFTVNGMTVGILTVLVFGAGTDYALLLVARYREELRRHEDHHEAMAVALRRAAPAIAVSGFTVVLALLCLLVAQLSDIAALGPTCAAGIVCALAAQLLFLPALMAAAGRRALWPFVPRPGGGDPEQSGGFWRLSRALVRRPRAVWVSLALALGVCCSGLLAYQGGVNQQNGFRGTVGSVEAQDILVANFPSGETAPAAMLVDRSQAASASAVARSAPGVSAVGAPVVLGAMDMVDVSLAAPPTSGAAAHAVMTLRDRLAMAGEHALVGGETATNVDLSAAAGHDRTLIIPIVLAVVLLMLALLLRSLVAPLVLVASVLLSYLASLGVSAVVFRAIFGFPGFDASVPIFGFVFLVALGVDYNIFLMARVREEASEGAVLGVQRGLAVTGSVITSAGVVLAATFAVLGVLPLIALTEVGFLVAFGVLVDTVLVRSALVPALAMDIGPKLWWPSSLVARST